MSPLNCSPANNDLQLNALQFLKQSIPFLLLLLLAWQLYPLTSNIPVEWSGLAKIAPAIVFLLAALLGFHFNRTSIAISSMLVSAYWLLANNLVGADTSLAAENQGENFLVFCWLWIMLAIYGFSKDQHILSPPNLVKLVGLGLLAAGLYFLDGQYPGLYASLQNTLSSKIPATDSGPIFASTNLIQLTLIILLAIALLVRAFIENEPVASSQFFAIPVILMATLLENIELAHILFVTAGLISAIAILFSSYNLAFRDELTGLSSRRALNHDLDSLGRRYTIAMLDIDHFKKFNDTHGHDIGDQVLKMVASQIAKTGGGAKVYRYGGEEFTALFPRKDPDHARHYLEELRESIEKYKMGVRSQPRPQKNTKNQKNKRKAGNKKVKTLSVTVSIGIAERDDKNRTASEVIKAADKALYKAKKKGRNCVV